MLVSVSNLTVLPFSLYSFVFNPHYFSITQSDPMGKVSRALFCACAHSSTGVSRVLTLLWFITLGPEGLAGLRHYNIWEVHVELHRMS